MSANIDRVRSAFAGRYAIESELGSGGMATVYLARDEKHERQVAVKVLRADLASTVGHERFPREIRIAARLTHPHILPLHDSGEMEGLLYYVMPYAEGESLRARLDREGPLPVMEVVRVLREVVDALAYAHAHGVVHRDIKPDNVMVAGRHSLVMDFGVAKALSDASSQVRMTTAGIALGTPTYMAPEQASAEPQIDHRVDIYAVGVLGYELLTGQPPFSGSATTVLTAHLTQKPQPVGDVRGGIPLPLAHLIMKCLEKEPDRRWQRADEMLPVLEALVTPSGGVTPTATAAVRAAATRGRQWWLAAAAAGLVLVAAGAGFLLGGKPGSGADGSGTAPRVERLAVLPMQNLSGDASQGGLVDAIHDALITELAQQSGINVISRTSVLRYRLTEKPLAEIARELNVDAIIEGSVQRQGARIRVSAKLVHAATERPLWAQSYEREGQDLFAIQGEVVRTMTQDIMARIGGGTPGTSASAPRSSRGRVNERRRTS